MFSHNFTGLNSFNFNGIFWKLRITLMTLGRTKHVCNLRWTSLLSKLEKSVGGYRHNYSNLNIQGIPRKKYMILKGYNFLNIYGRKMKQKLQLRFQSFITCIYLLLNNPPLATIQFRMRRHNSPMALYRVSAAIDTMISLTCSFTWLIVANFFFWFHLSYNPKNTI